MLVYLQVHVNQIICLCLAVHVYINMLKLLHPDSEAVEKRVCQHNINTVMDGCRILPSFDKSSEWNG